MRIFVLVVAVLTFSTFACRDTAPTLLQPDDALLSHHGSTGLPDHVALPFHGTTRGGVVGVVMDNDCPEETPVLFVMAGEGRFTHLGKTSIYGSECGPEDFFDASVTHTANARFTLTAANGDQIVVAYDGAEIIREMDPIRVGWRAEPEVVYGTGRFADVELIDVIWAGWVLDLTTFAMASEVTGWIRY